MCAFGWSLAHPPHTQSPVQLHQPALPEPQVQEQSLDNVLRDPSVIVPVVCHGCRTCFSLLEVGGGAARPLLLNETM